MDSMELGNPPDFSEDVGALKKGPWTSAEDAILVNYVTKHGEGNWNSVQKHSGLFRCGKSCRLRWANHLRPNLKKGAFTPDEERMIIELHAKLGNKWARMAAQLPGRTDNEIKNYWNTRIKRRMRAGLPVYPPEMQNPVTSSQYMFEHGEMSLSSGGESECDPASSPTNEFQNLNVSGMHHGGGGARGAGSSGGGGGCPMKSCSTLTGLSGDLPLSSIVTQTLSGSGGQPPMGSPVRRMKRMHQRDSQSINGVGAGGAGGSGSSTATAAVLFPQLSDESSKAIPYFKARRSCGTRSNSTRLAQIAGFSTYDPDPENNNLHFVDSNGMPSHHGYHHLGHQVLPHSCSRPNSGLKLELPSSQSAESADSAGTAGSAMTSPYTSFSLTNHLMSTSEADSFGSNNNNNNSSNSSFLEALLQEAQTLDVGGAGAGGQGHGHGNSHDQVRSAAELSDQLLVLTAANPLMDVVSLLSPRKIRWGEDSDPTTPLEGRTYSMFSEDTSPNCTSNWDEASTLHSPLATISSTLQSPHHQQPQPQPQPQPQQHHQHHPHHHGIKLESPQQQQQQIVGGGSDIPCGNYGDEENLISTLLDFARPDEAPVTEWYNPGEMYTMGGGGNDGGASGHGIGVGVGVAQACATSSLPGVIEAAFHHHQDVGAGELDHLGVGGVGSAGGVHPVPNHVWELGSCPWNNMPGVCQIGDLAADCRPLTSLAEQMNDPCAIC